VILVDIQLCLRCSFISTC